jgi:hypothetical protein
MRYCTSQNTIASSRERYVMVSHEIIFFASASEPSDLILNQVADEAKLLILLSANGILQYRPFIFSLTLQIPLSLSIQISKIRGEEET